jgi:hypothetical protein
VNTKPIFASFLLISCSGTSTSPPPQADPAPEVVPAPPEVAQPAEAAEVEEVVQEETPEEKKGKIEVPDFNGQTASSFNFTVTGQTIEVPANSFFEINLGVPTNVPESYQYTWARPQIRGRVRFVTREETPENKGVIGTRFIFFAEEGQGTLGVKRKYKAATADPAPDFGIKVKILPPG